MLYEVLTSLDKDRRILLPLNISSVVPDTFLKTNIKFEFIDINNNTLCMDEKLALEVIKNGSSIGGVWFVKTFGIKMDGEVYEKIRDANPDFFVDDQCLSI